jgi:hypothetical protein
MTDRFDAVRAWVGELRPMPHCRVEMRVPAPPVRHQRLPHEVWVDTLDDALALDRQAARGQRASAPARS